MSRDVAKDFTYPLFTLRKHQSPVTAQCYLYIPVTTVRGKRVIDFKNNLTATLKPYLLAADESGHCTIWDLAVRRPALEFQAHEQRILTVKQLGLDFNLEVSSDFFGQFITHGRDNCVRFWRILDERSNIELKLLYELPVNSLNFCNVDVLDKLIITSNTLDSNFFDIYDIGFIVDEAKDDNRLKRIFSAVDLYTHIKTENLHDFSEFNVKIEEEDQRTRANKFGIIMRVLLLEKNTVIIGYESGHVISVQLDVQAEKFRVITISNSHFPNPVLSLTCEPSTGVVLSSSTQSAIVVHKSSLVSELLRIPNNFGKISSIATLKNHLILASWNGYIKFYKFLTKVQGSSTIEEIATFKKPKASIIGDLNIIGNTSDDHIDRKKDQLVRPNCLSATQGQTIKKHSKNGLNRRDIGTIESNWLAVGYDDGTVILYNDL